MKRAPDKTLIIRDGKPIDELKRAERRALAILYCLASASWQLGMAVLCVVLRRRKSATQRVDAAIDELNMIRYEGEVEL